MYVLIQRVLSLMAEATTPRPPRFDPRHRLAHELQRLLIDVADDDLPSHLREALRSGAVVGVHAAEWLPHVKRWLADECARTAV